MLARAFWRGVHLELAARQDGKTLIEQKAQACSLHGKNHRPVQAEARHWHSDIGLETPPSDTQRRMRKKDGDERMKSENPRMSDGRISKRHGGSKSVYKNTSAHHSRKSPACDHGTRHPDPGPQRDLARHAHTAMDAGRITTRSQGERPIHGPGVAVRRQHKPARPPREVIDATHRCSGIRGRRSQESVDARADAEEGKGIETPARGIMNARADTADTRRDDKGPRTVIMTVITGAGWRVQRGAAQERSHSGVGVREEAMVGVAASKGIRLRN
ncbi:hypothetical protein C8R44DRAFT_741687 [Mycena epipterygia]|nr:hypothetical protein C8R44DRAFT_741687 [Mycena epipterygia]